MGPVGIVELEDIALLPQDVGGLDAALGRFAGHDHQGLLVPVGGAAHKIIGPGIFGVDDAVLDELVDVDEALGQLPRLWDADRAQIHNP